MSKYDCMMMDGLYKGTHTKLIEIDNEEGGELKECNFRFPLRKIRMLILVWVNKNLMISLEDCDQKSNPLSLNLGILFIDLTQIII